MSKIQKNISNDGYTTYHNDGNKSVTYKNITNDGHTTYHDNGKKTVTYKNVLNDGYTSYTSDVGSSIGAIFFAIIAFALCIICTFSIFKYTSILSLVTIIISVPFYFVVKKVTDTITATLWSELVIGFGFHRFSAVVFKYAWNLGFPDSIFAIFGLLIIILGVCYFHISRSDDDNFGYSLLFVLSLTIGFLAEMAKESSNIPFMCFMLIMLLETICAMVLTVKSIKKKRTKNIPNSQNK